MPNYYLPAGIICHALLLFTVPGNSSSDLTVGDRTFACDGHLDSASLETALIYLSSLSDVAQGAFERYDGGCAIARFGHSPVTALFLASVLRSPLDSTAGSMTPDEIRPVFDVLFGCALNMCLASELPDCRGLIRRLGLGPTAAAVFLINDGLSSVESANQLLARIGIDRVVTDATELDKLHDASIMDVHALLTSSAAPHSHDGVRAIQLALDRPIWHFPAEPVRLDDPLSFDLYALVTPREPGEAVAVADWVLASHPTPEQEATGESVAVMIFSPTVRDCLKGECGRLKSLLLNSSPWVQAMFLRYIIGGMVYDETARILLEGAGFVVGDGSLIVTAFRRLTLATIHALLTEDGAPGSGIQRLLETRTVTLNPEYPMYGLKSSAGILWQATVTATGGAISPTDSTALADTASAAEVYRGIFSGLVSECIASVVSGNCGPLFRRIRMRPVAMALVIYFGALNLPTGRSSLLMTLLSGMPTFVSPAAALRLRGKALAGVITAMKDSPLDVAVNTVLDSV